MMNKDDTNKDTNDEGIFDSYLIFSRLMTYIISYDTTNYRDET
jgi:hypothetical protein